MKTTKDIQAKPFKITGNWQIGAKRLKEEFPYLTDTDLKFEPGKENELVCRVRNRLYMTRAEVVDIIEKTQTKIPILNKYKLPPKLPPNRLLPEHAIGIHKPEHKWNIKLSLLKYLL